jgi:hypothetical protein
MTSTKGVMLMDERGLGVCRTEKEVFMMSEGNER